MDPARRRRRRGEELLDAIRQATLDELVEVGYARLTVDAVAQRAGAGKASVYRHWPTRVDLVADAVLRRIPSFDPPPDVGDVRTQLLAALTQAADDLNGPNGALARAMIAETIRHPDLVEGLREHLVTRISAPFFEVLRRGSVRGVVRPAALSPLVVSAGPHLLCMHFLISTAPLEPTIVREIVDEVLVPLVEARSADRLTSDAGRT